MDRAVASHCHRAADEERVRQNIVSHARRDGPIHMLNLIYIKHKLKTKLHDQIMLQFIMAQSPETPSPYRNVRTDERAAGALRRSRRNVRARLNIPFARGAIRHRSPTALRTVAVLCGRERCLRVEFAGKTRIDLASGCGFSSPCHRSRRAVSARSR